LGRPPPAPTRRDNRGQHGRPTKCQDGPLPRDSNRLASSIVDGISLILGSDILAHDCNHCSIRTTCAYRSKREEVVARPSSGRQAIVDGIRIAQLALVVLLLQPLQQSHWDSSFSWQGSIAECASARTVCGSLRQSRDHLPSTNERRQRESTLDCYSFGLFSDCVEWLLAGSIPLQDQVSWNDDSLIGQFTALHRIDHIPFRDVHKYSLGLSSEEFEAVKHHAEHQSKAVFYTVLSLLQVRFLSKLCWGVAPMVRLLYYVRVLAPFSCLLCLYCRQSDPKSCCASQMVPQRV